jgi:hypothetical protein
LRFGACVGQRGVVAGEVVEHAVGDDEDVFGEVERRGYYEEGEEEEEDGVWWKVSRVRVKKGW